MKDKVFFLPLLIGIGIIIAGGLWRFLSVGSCILIFVTCLLISILPQKLIDKKVKKPKEIYFPPAIRDEKKEEKQVLVAREVTTVVKRVRSIYGKEIA